MTPAKLVLPLAIHRCNSLMVALLTASCLSGCAEERLHGLDNQPPGKPAASTAPDIATSPTRLFFTTNPVGHGTGLGLPICYGIVEKMGGRITVESEIEKGTTFTVFIPREAPKGATKVTASGESAT